MSHNLYVASQQWATRPADETYASVEAMHEACAYYRAQAKGKLVPASTLRVEALDGDVRLVSRSDIVAPNGETIIGHADADGWVLRDAAEG